jgi:alpha-galactosidase/6-phospho-beta-glucosidase family protein
LGGGGRYAGLNHLGWFWDLPSKPGLYPLKYLARVFGGRLPAIGRAAELAALSAAALVDPGAADARAMPWFAEALVPAVRAQLGGEAWTGFANLPNAGWLPELPKGHVVELAARWSSVIEPRAPGPLPPAIVPFLQAIARSEALGLRAARRQDAQQLRAALAALPMALSSPALDGLTQAAIQPIRAVAG